MLTKVNRFTSNYISTKIGDFDKGVSAFVHPIALNENI